MINVILSTGRSEDPGCRAFEQGLAAALQNRPDVQLAVVPHLYDLAPDGPVIEYLQSVDGDLIVAARLYSRAVHWLLDANSVKGRFGDSEQQTGDRPQRTIWCLDLRSFGDVESATAEIERIAAASAGSAASGQEISAEEQTKYRWYPVIDYDRCENCMECLNFCLFGVLGVDESQQIIVEQPDACRSGCPACSRVCPSRAIMFPMHATPAIAGDPAAQPDAFNLNLVQLLGTSNPPDLATTERYRALAEKAEADKTPRDDLDDLVDELDEMDL